MNKYVKFFEINVINQIYWIFEGKNKLIPKANSIANIEIFISPSDPLHTLESHSPLQQVVLQKQVLKGWSLLHSESSVGLWTWGKQKRLV